MLTARIRRALDGEGTDREARLARAWTGSADPERILVMRLHAIGDAVLTLPIVAGLRERYPKARLGFVIGERAAPVAQLCRWVDEVFVLPHPESRRARIAAAVSLGRRLGDWDVVVDLQRNLQSRVVRRMVAPRAFGEMDRFSARHGLERCLSAVTDAGLESKAALVPHLRADLVAEARARLERAAPGAERFVLLNPGGAMPTRRWPTERWTQLAREFPGRPAFVVCGVQRVEALARALAAAEGVRSVDLVGTNLSEGLATVAACDLVVSEDGAFMHAAWCGGVPTVGLLGGVRSDWVRPLGPSARFFGSEDLPCGGCMRDACERGDVHCMDRVGVRDVLDVALGVPA